MFKRFLFITTLFVTICSNANAQRTTDKLDRGLVAVPASTGTFVSWRIFGEEYYDTEYNLYRNGTPLNQQPLKVSNFVDKNGRTGDKYVVEPIVRGVPQEKSAPVECLSQQYIEIAVKDLYSRRGTRITNDYNINDIALADVDGDGISELIMKRNYGPDGSSVANDSAYNCIECYTMKGERLWYIDLGPNMVSGPDEQYDAVGYDWDGDGKAEILMRGADNMIIHHADGSTTNIGSMSVNTRNTVNQTANMTYTNTGAEYLLYLEGRTGKPYAIGSNGQLWMDYPLPRGNASDWGDGYGHRSTKHYFGAPFLDGRKPYIFLGRGCYTKHHMKAFSVNPQTHKLTQYWEWSNNGGWSDPWYGNGFHNFGIADVDWDGRDEICFGSMVIDDNGKGLSTTGLGHGDAQHCSDFDPYRHGQEIFTCNEDEPAMNYRNATTSKIYYRLQSTSDDGRAICGNFSNSYPGCIGHSSQSGVVSCVADKVINGAPNGFAMNWRIYWDGDLLEEALDGANSREGASRVFKADGTTVFTANGTANCNWTKNTPSATGDILGDWREEIVARTTDNKYVRVYTTNIPTDYRNYTLWHDHQYRQAMVWQSMGYNQPPHASYFLGELEGITIAPPPLTMTGRTEVTNGGTIGSNHNDQHVMVCETRNTKVTVADNAQPYMMTFNVPSWVQGTNSTNTSGNPTINRTYYTCTVEGAAFTGAMRLVKQGDGILNLPAVEQQYTGETNIWAGTVNFDGTLLQSSVWMNRFAQLNSNGGKFRSIKMDFDATLRPGRADNCGTINTDTLQMGFGSRIVFDLYADKSADKLFTDYMDIETKNWQYGPQYLSPVFEFVYHGDAQPLPGTYILGTAKELKGNLSDIKLEGLGTKVKAELTIQSDTLYLNIDETRAATTILWTGIQDNVWDMALSENFTFADEEEPTPESFVSGDNVIFDDTSERNNVSINGEIEADTIFVSNNSKNYIFSGTGTLVGNTTLVKSGTGMLTIQNEHTYTGGNHFSGGVVSVSSLANANKAKGNLGGVTTLSNKFVLENGAELRTTAAVTNGSTIRFDGEKGGVINNSADFIADRAMGGTVLKKTGAGWMKFNNANTTLQRLIIANGTIQCINCATPAKIVEYQGGTLHENTSTSYAVEVAKGKKGTWYMANRATYTNKITGEGTLTIYCTTEKGTNYYATRTPVQCDFSSFEGTIVPTSSQDDPSVLRFTLNTSSGMPNGTMDIPENVQVQNSGRTFRIGKLAGKGSLGGGCTFSNGASVGANTWQVGNDGTWTSTVRVTSNSNLVKVGSGKVTWNAVNDNTGTTTINEGELAVNSTTQLGTGTLTVGSEGTLMGSNSSKNTLTNSTVIVNGTLRPGILNGATSGSILFNQKAVTINENGKLVIGTKGCATATTNGCTSIQGISTLTINGTISIVPSASHNLQVGDSIRIFQATKFAGTPRFDMQGGIEWDTSRLAEGLLFVKSLSSGISTIINDRQPCDIYNTKGQLVRAQATSTEGLAPGIYVARGRKFIVK